MRHRRGPSCPWRIGVMEGKSSTPSKATLPVVPNEGTNTGGQLWGHGGGAIIEEAVTSALNARSWQSGSINEGMTPEQCHLVCYNSHQVKESIGWDRYSSSDLHDQQMDGQDEWSRRIYNNRDLTREGGERGGEKEAGQSQVLGLLKALAVKHRRTAKKKNSSLD